MGDEYADDEEPDGATEPDAASVEPAGGDGVVLPDEVEYPERNGEPGTALPRRVESWRRRSATGAMLTGFAFGLREVLEVEHREPAIVLETSGVPPKDLPVEADLDNLPPRQSVVRIRRWLLADQAQPDGGTPATDLPATDTGGTAVAPAAPRPPTELRRRDTGRKPRLSLRLGHHPRRS